MQKTALNLQDVFLARARRANLFLTVFLMNGFQMHGVVAGFDSFTVVLNSDGKQQLIYKHAISTIIPVRPVDMSEDAEAE
jgi:host factor-I protein